MRISDWSSDVCSSDLHGIIIKLQDRKPRLQPPVLKGIIQQDQVMIILQSFNSSNPVRIHSNRNIAKPGKILVRLIPDQGGANFRYGFMACPDKSRSEERRVGKECVSTCRSRWSPSN